MLSACAEPPYTNIGNPDIKPMQAEGVVLYDIRRPEEWRQTGVVEGSRLLTFVDGGGRVNPEFFETFAREVAKDQPVMLICRTGNRTNVLARLLVEKLGYTKVYNVEHGITAWLRDRQPVTRL
ncbi:MAG: rhodanese-like domain-containing protein [Gammaproteobacteria bacterium]|nr:rhodanese-like domain-containing protein [Gammaproteobacteria bacterium]MCP5136639.1 rhodanese-like domain-containing protein [Gammaproteobacteria bacterium]